jgi:predicted O-methyltransferase YrrM
MKFDLKDIVQMIDGFGLVDIHSDFLKDRLDYMHNPDEATVPLYYHFFYELTKRYKPNIVIELGTCTGSSAACFAAGCEDTTVITVDHHTDPGDEDNIHKTMEAAFYLPNIIYCRGWTTDTIYDEEYDKHSIPGENAYPKVLSALDGEKADILFIDSWHHGYQAMRDWNVYKELLTSPALVICDDISNGSPEGGIYDMVDGFWNKMDYEKHLSEGVLHFGYAPMGFFKYED